MLQFAGCLLQLELFEYVKHHVSVDYEFRFLDTKGKVEFIGIGYVWFPIKGSVIGLY